MNIIIAVVLSLIIGLVIGLFLQKKAKAGSVGSITGAGEHFRTITTFVTMALGLVFVGGWLTWKFGVEKGPQDELQMGVLVVAAIVTLMTILFILAAGFNSMQLAEPKQPLGLPEGSVRAMIALILIMVFIIFGIYLFRMVGTGAYTLVDNLKEEPSAAVLEKYQSPGKRRPFYEKNSEGLYAIWTWSDVSDDGKRLAQQLITTVGTLVVAVAGFYFGSATATSAAKKDREDTNPLGLAELPAPIIISLKPNEGEKDHHIDVQILGKGFKSPTHVQFVRDGQIMECRVLSWNATSLRCDLTLDKEPGSVWDLLVVNDDGKQARLPHSFTINKVAV